MLNFFQNLSPELIIASLSALPFTELRGSIPIALGVYKLPVVTAFFLAVLGNIAAAVLVLLGLEFFSGYLMRKFSLANRFLNWLFKRTRESHQKKFEGWKELALMLFVAVPLPLTGAWSGALCSFIFGIPVKRAIIAISLGVVIAGLLVTLISYGAINCC
ncbi:MAG: small multi-drug export protein [Candidatus Nealsonbacteria bacterium]|nr:small multi-drug export protein [Candidatus Nealsonbacteria bacterium]